MKKKIFKLFSFILIVSLGFIPLKIVNAASAKIAVTSSASRIVVGKTFTVRVKITSAAALGSYEYTLSFDSSKIKLVSGSISEADTVKNSSTKSITKSYTFKAIGSGNSTITVKSYDVIGFDETTMSKSVSSASVKVITQAELEASYSTNNNLSNLTVNGYSISPVFNKDTLNYTVSLNPDVEQITVNATRADSTASVRGAGNISVSEGDNKIEIVVTSQKGTTKTYTLIATVIDNNPIDVTIDEEKYTVVKKETTLEKPNTYSETTVEIGDQKVPGFTSEITNYTLVGLKNSTGEIKLAIYNKDTNTYSLYKEILTNNLIISPLPTDDVDKDYIKSNVTIGDITFTAYKLTSKSDYSLIYGINVETGDKGWYAHDSKDNTIQRYNTEEINKLEQKLEDGNLIIMILSGALGLTLILLLIVSIKSLSKKNKKIDNLEKAKKKVEKNLDKTKEIILDKHKETKKEIKEEIKEKKKDIKEDIKEVKKEIKEEIKEVKKDIEEKKEDLTKNETIVTPIKEEDKTDGETYAYFFDIKKKDKKNKKEKKLKNKKDPDNFEW